MTNSEQPLRVITKPRGIINYRSNSDIIYAVEGELVDYPNTVDLLWDKLYKRLVELI